MQPKMLVVDIGETANFRCISSGHTTWFFKNNTRPYHVGVDLTITNVDAEKQGYYICNGRTKNGHKIQARAHLIVRGNLRVFMFIYSQ